MAHPKSGVSELAECYYIYTLRVKNKDDYWDINLNETENARHIVKTKVWTHKAKEPILVKITTNDKYCIITLPNGAVYTASINNIEKSSQLSIHKIKEKEEHKRKTKEFQELLNTLGIRFEIDDHYMTVFFQDKEIFSGTTKDLNNE